MAGLQIRKADAPNRHADEAQGWQSDCRGHVADLALFAFAQFDLDPGSGNVRSHRPGARRQIWIGNEASFCRQSDVILQSDPALELR